jgi:hypothetical protein
MFAALAAIVLLQLPPIPGIFFLLFGAPLIAGLLVHVFLATLFIEAVIGRIPRTLVVVPLLAYGGYCGMYAQETWRIAVESAKLRGERPGLTLKFDPTIQNLAVKDARSFIDNHDISVAYEPSPITLPDGYISYRRLPTDQCAEAHATWAELPSIVLRAKISVQYRTVGGPLTGVTDTNTCVLQLPERPRRDVVSVIERGGEPEWKEGPGIHERTFDFSVGGKLVAAYRTAWINRLPIFPSIVIGCWLIDNPPEWRCTAGFTRARIEIAADPNDKGDVARDDPIGAVLGIPRLSKKSLETAPPAVDFDAILVEIKSYQQRLDDYKAAHDDDLFTAFVRFLNNQSYQAEQQGAWRMVVVDGNEKIPSGMREAIDKDPSRLSPLRDQMVAKLVELDRNGISTVSPWADLVKHALLMLPKAQFAAMPDETLQTLLGYLTKTEAWRYGGLYIRAADAGARTLEFYAKDLARMAKTPGSRADNPAMAICRIGRADEATKQTLENLYMTSRPSKPSMAILQVVRKNSAFVVALLGLRDDQFLRDNPLVTEDPRVRRWYDLVLDGKGRTDVGPNNCMEMTQQAFGQSPSMTPSIVWENRDFVESVGR